MSCATPASLGGCGSRALPSSSSVLSQCPVTLSDGDEKSEFLSAPSSSRLPGDRCSSWGWPGRSHRLPAHLAEQGFRAVVCLDSIAALLHLSAGQSGTQDYETSSHEPLPRTPTCTTCKCQGLLSPFASSPCGNVVPKVGPLWGQQGARRGMLMGKERQRWEGAGDGKAKCTGKWNGLQCRMGRAPTGKLRDLGSYQLPWL